MRTSNINKKRSLLTILLIIFILSPINYFAQNSISFNSNNGRNKISISNNKNDFKIEYEGEITLNEIDSDIVDISKGGYIEIKKSSFGKKRKIIIEKEGNKLIRKYYVGWSEKDYYPEGKQWLSDVLPEILRSTTIGAESRVDRFYKKGGAKDVLDEIKKMESDYVQSAYFKLLLKKPLSSKEVTNTLNTVGKVISSDHYLANILRKNQELFLKNSSSIDAYISAAKTVGSDHYLTQILKSIISNKEIDDAQLASLLTISENINSDHYLSEVLGNIMDERKLNENNMEQVMKLSKNIGSDHYKTNTLKKALRNKNLSKQAYNSFMNSLNDINSDHYASEVIKELVKNKLDNESFNNVLEIITKNISSSHYAASIYKEIAKNKDLNETQLIHLLNAVDSIESSHELSQVLIAFAPKVKNASSKVKEAYTKTAKSINSETYFGRAMKAIY